MQSVGVLLDEIARTSADVAATSARSRKIDRIAACLAGLRPEEVEVAVSYLSGELPQGSIGVGWAALREPPPPATGAPALELLAVDAAVSRIASVSGKGSQERTPPQKMRELRPVKYNTASCGAPFAGRPPEWSAGAFPGLR